MSAPRRLDIRIDFRLHRGASGHEAREERTRAVRDIEKYAARKLARFPEVEVESIESVRVDEERT